jgi:hypothetical protein
MYFLLQHHPKFKIQIQIKRHLDNKIFLVKSSAVNKTFVEQQRTKNLHNNEILINISI